VSNDFNIPEETGTGFLHKKRGATNKQQVNDAGKASSRAPDPRHQTNPKEEQQGKTFSQRSPQLLSVQEVREKPTNKKQRTPRGPATSRISRKYL